MSTEVLHFAKVAWAPVEYFRAFMPSFFLIARSARCSPGHDLLALSHNGLQGKGKSERSSRRCKKLLGPNRSSRSGDGIEAADLDLLLELHEEILVVLQGGERSDYIIFKLLLTQAFPTAKRGMWHSEPRCRWPP
jgi:hypothetical protein